MSHEGLQVAGADVAIHTESGGPTSYQDHQPPCRSRSQPPRSVHLGRTATLDLARLPSHLKQAEAENLLGDCRAHHAADTSPIEPVRQLACSSDADQRAPSATGMRLSGRTVPRATFRHDSGYRPQPSSSTGRPRSDTFSADADRCTLEASARRRHTLHRARTLTDQCHGCTSRDGYLRSVKILKRRTLSANERSLVGGESAHSAGVRDTSHERQSGGSESYGDGSLLHTSPFSKC